MEEKSEERYIRPDVNGGFLYNKSEIDYYKQTQVVDVMANLMLGDFGGNGNYVLTKGVVDQLVKMKKIYQYSFGTTTFCQSENDIEGYGKIDFAVKIRNNNQNKTVTATLQLLETIDRANGYYQNTNTASIAVYTAPESNSYIVDMLRYFNIVSKKDDGLVKKDKTDEPIDLIVARKKFMEQLRQSALPIIDEQHKVLYEKRFKMLSKSAIGKTILAEFNKESYKINGWFVKEGMPGYFRYLNQVLDGLFEVHSAEVLQDVALKAAWNKANETFSMAMLNAMKKTPQEILINKAQAQDMAKKTPVNLEKQPEVIKKPEEQKLEVQKPNEDAKKPKEDNKKLKDYFNKIEVSKLATESENAKNISNEKVNQVPSEDIKLNVSEKEVEEFANSQQITKESEEEKSM